MSQRRDRPEIDLPEPASDHPIWARVGVIATVGFVIGIGWPRLAGIRLGPNPPEEAKPAAVAVAIPSKPEPPPATSSSAAAVASSTQASMAGPVQVQTAVVGRAQVLSCRDRKGKPVDGCDNPDFDSIVGQRLKNLAKCQVAVGLTGKLSIGFDVDFQRNAVKLVRGKSTTLPASTYNGIWQCAERELASMNVSELRHDHARYVVFYLVHFYAPGKVIEPEPPAGPVAAEALPEPKKDKSAGAAQVVYDSAVVRDEPKTGKIVARLVRGTRVQVVSRRGEWVSVRFADREGWVFRSAIGL